MRKDDVLRLRLSKADRIAVQKAAAIAGLSVSEFARRCMLGRRLLADEDMATISALLDVAEAIRARAIGVESEVVMERIRSEIEAQAARIERKRREKAN